MKKILLGLLIILVVGGAVLAFLYRKNLEGIKPVFQTPDVSITEVFEQKDNPTLQADLPKVDFPLQLPEGFEIALYATNTPGARVLRMLDNNVIVSLPKEGKVVMLVDENKDGKVETIKTLLSELELPHGLEVQLQGAEEILYVAEMRTLWKYDYNKNTKELINKTKITDLAGGGRHTSRTLLQKENQIYVSIGSSCDVCHEEDPRQGTVQVWDGTELKPFAIGLRNAVFMAVHPVTGKIWVTEMGRDRLGDNLPPDEINILEAEKNYGWPICYGKNIHDTNFDKRTYIRNPCLEPFETPAYIDLPAHSAPLGLAFIPADSEWPEEYWNNLLISYHGSWNRSVPTGYKIVRYRLDENGNYSGTAPQEEDFVSGWLDDGKSYGRPVDLLVQKDGSMYVSDDKAGVIYKITYKK